MPLRNLCGGWRCSELKSVLPGCFYRAERCTNAFGVRTHAAPAPQAPAVTVTSSAAAWNSSLGGCCARAVAALEAARRTWRPLWPLVQGSACRRYSSRPLEPPSSTGSVDTGTVRGLTSGSGCTWIVRHCTHLHLVFTRVPSAWPPVPDRVARRFDHATAGRPFRSL